MNGNQALQTKIHRLFNNPQERQNYTNKKLSKATLRPEFKLVLMRINQDSKKLLTLKQILIHTLEHTFKAHPEDFHTSKYHYDWWVFPMHVPTSWGWEQRNYDASIDLKEAQTLYTDDEFRHAYISCIDLYLSALEKQGWNEYPVRFARMMRSLDLFLNAGKELESECSSEPLQNLARRALKCQEDMNLTVLYRDYGLLVSSVNSVKCLLDMMKEEDINTSIKDDKIVPCRCV
jgi:hypothetical protein